MFRKLIITTSLLFSGAAFSAEVQVAVAANFTAPMQKIAVEFEKDTGHKALLSFGSTGKLYAQISNGAPFDILVSADEKTPIKLVTEGKGIAGSRLTYATGKLVLWSSDPKRVDAKGSVLAKGDFRHLAIASPRLAPYGAAAIEVLTSLKLLEAVQPKFVQGENLAQTYQFIASGNAELGFVALSQVMKDGKLTDGSAWVVPSELYSPIRQDIVLLQKGLHNAAATALMKYLSSEKAKREIRAFGYEI